MFYAAEANDHVEDLEDFGFKGMEKQPFDWKLVFGLINWIFDILIIKNVTYT